MDWYYRVKRTLPGASANPALAAANVTLAAANPLPPPTTW